MSATEAAEINQSTTAAQRAVIKSLHRYACLLHTEERYDEAEAEYRKVVRMDPDNGRYTLELGWTVFKNRSRLDEDRLDEAADWLDRAVDMLPTSAQAHYCQAVYYMAAGSADSSEAALKTALTHNPQHKLARRALDRIGSSRMKMAEERPAFLVNRFAEAVQAGAEGAR
jgi:tetratricopeptide (TPR) repeat protein